MKKMLFASLLSILAVAPAQTLAAPSLQAHHPCTDDEEWSAPSPSNSVPDPDTLYRFHSMLSGHVTPVQALQDALKFQGSANTPEKAGFAGYWYARALLEAGLPHLAFDRFGAVASQSASGATAGIAAASLTCLNSIYARYPALPLPGAIAGALPAYVHSLPKAEDRQPVWQFASEWVKSRVGRKDSRRDVESALAALKGAGPYEAFASGLVAASRGDHRETVNQLDKFFGHGASPGKLPASLRSHAEDAQLLLARAYYGLHRYPEAAREYARVSRRSNRVTEMLSELAWTHLQAGNSGKAVGVALQLRSGLLKKTFAPESLVVAAMALNEACQYPAAMKAVKTFYAEYQSARNWLEANLKGKGSAALYDLALSYVEDQETRVPEKVASEWIRSNMFINGQTEIRGLFQELKALAELAESAPAELQSALASARGALVARQQDLATWIEADLSSRNRRMLAQLNESSETMNLIQVEIRSGGSHDMIFQNANPEYPKFSRKLKDALAEQEPATPAWNWGNVRLASERSELWEDEIGALKARLQDQCVAKDRYLKARKAVSSR